MPHDCRRYGWKIIENKLRPAVWQEGVCWHRHGRHNGWLGSVVRTLKQPALFLAAVFEHWVACFVAETAGAQTKQAATVQFLVLPPPPTAHQSLNAESARLFHSQEQLLVEHVEGGVRREIQAVEACVGPGQAGGLPPLLNAELARPIAAAQGCEALIRDAGGARDKLQQA